MKLQVNYILELFILGKIIQRFTIKYHIHNRFLSTERLLNGESFPFHFPKRFANIFCISITLFICWFENGNSIFFMDRFLLKKLLSKSPFPSSFSLFMQVLPWAVGWMVRIFECNLLTRAQKKCIYWYLMLILWSLRMGELLFKGFRCFPTVLQGQYYIKRKYHNHNWNSWPILHMDWQSSGNTESVPGKPGNVFFSLRYEVFFPLAIVVFYMSLL